MTFHKSEKCGFFCQLSKFVRRSRWLSAKRPISWHIEAGSYTAVKKHLSTGRY